MTKTLTLEHTLGDSTAFALGMALDLFPRCIECGEDLRELGWSQLMYLPGRNRFAHLDCNEHMPLGRACEANVTAVQSQEGSRSRGMGGVSSASGDAHNER